MTIVCTHCNKNENLSVYVEDVGLVLFVPQRNEWVHVSEDDFDDKTDRYVISPNATVIDTSNFEEDDICCDCIEDYTTVKWTE